MRRTPIQIDSAYATAESGAYILLKEEATAEKAKALAQQLNLDPPQYAYQRDEIIDKFYQQVRGKITMYLSQHDVNTSMFLNERTAKNWQRLCVFHSCEKAVKNAYPEENILPNIAWYTTAPVFRAVCTVGAFSHAVFANIIAGSQ